MQSNTIPEDETAADRAGDGEYFVSEIFHSIQGEGVQSGTPMTFVRFGGCNLRCRRESAGFDCDTDFKSGQSMSGEEIAERVLEVAPEPRPGHWILFTGGEPGLQLTPELIETLDAEANEPLYSIETNGTVDLSPARLDWICVSPKSAWHTVRQREANELKLVRAPGQDLPALSEVPVDAEHLVVSPRFEPDGSVRQETLDHCIDLVRRNPEWRLSLQTHKFLQAR